jgi:hypothetical protein
MNILIVSNQFRQENFPLKRRGMPSGGLGLGAEKFSGMGAAPEPKPSYPMTLPFLITL